MNKVKSEIGQAESDKSFHKYSASLLLLDAVFVVVTIALFVVFPPKVAFLYAVLFFVGCSFLLIVVTFVGLITAFRKSN